MHKIPVIYWNHGINLLDPNNVFKNAIYHLIHTLVDRILLYTPNEKKFIAARNQDKVYVANNTIVFDEHLYPVKISKEALKNKFNIDTPFNILFVGRDRIYKKLPLLIDLVKSLESNQIGLLIVGPLTERDKTEKTIEGFDNIQYLGEIYDKTILSQIYTISDVFCIPGTNGLGLNEAMFWGLPCLTLNVIHSPEIWYLKNGENGFIADNIQELKDIIIKLSRDKSLLQEMSDKARKIILSQGHIEKMFGGFEEVIHSLER